MIQKIKTTTSFAKSGSAATVSTVIAPANRDMAVTALHYSANDAACEIAVLLPQSESRTRVSEAASASATSLKIAVPAGYTAATGDIIVVNGYTVSEASAASTASGVATYTVAALPAAIPANAVAYVVRNGTDRWEETVGSATANRIGTLFASGGPLAPIVIQASAATSKSCFVAATVEHY